MKKFLEDFKKFALRGNVLEIVEMQAPNAKRMNAKTYLSGRKIEIGTRFGEE